MTFTIKQHTTKTHYISVSADGAYLIVEACPLLGDNMAGYADNRAVYHYSDRKNALATYRRYIKKYTEV